MVFNLLWWVCAAVTITHISTIAPLSSAEFLSHYHEGEKKMLTANVFRRDGGRRGISILTSSQKQADMWLDV